MRVETSYNQIFSQSTDLKIWAQLAYILKATDNFLESVRPSGKSNTEYFLKNRRQIVSFLTVSKILKKFDFSATDLIRFDLSEYNRNELQSVWDIVKKFIAQVNNHKVKRSVLLNLFKKIADMWNITGIDRIASEKEIISSTQAEKVETMQKSDPEKIQEKKEKVALEFAMKINELLPPQPWKPGIHKEICDKLNCRASDYFDAVKILIEEGIRYRQKDGVVYDEDGNVISFDEQRVDAQTLLLKNPIPAVS